MTFTLLERFMAKIERVPESGCWLWNAADNGVGYGLMADRATSKSPKLAHRIAYELFVGPIPPKATLDHLCRVRCCVNPAHLEPVSNLENIQRGARSRGITTHCWRGHEFSIKNTYIARDGRRSCRQCRKCNAESAARYRAKRHAAIASSCK